VAVAVVEVVPHSQAAVVVEQVDTVALLQVNLLVEVVRLNRL
jgi:hypothetical protein